MPDINFKRDYGYSDPSPSWFVMCRDMTISPLVFESRDLAEIAAAELARGRPGRTYHIVATVATVTTDIKIVGQNFDPARKAYPKTDDIPSPPVAAVEEAPL